jgi:hypothetical protein
MTCIVVIITELPEAAMVCGPGKNSEDSEFPGPWPVHTSVARVT